MYITRFYKGDESTTISLEEIFWDVIDQLSDKAGIKWQDWVRVELAGKPDNAGRATWLRVQVVKTLHNAVLYKECEKAA